MFELGGWELGDSESCLPSLTRIMISRTINAAPIIARRPPMMATAPWKPIYLISIIEKAAPSSFFDLSMVKAALAR